jgi:prepilin-type N-terminal cleavage/methylation domain-containing protein
MMNRNAIPGQQANSDMVQMNRRLSRQCGFSLVELLVVVIIALILAAFAIPSMITSLRMAHLRGAASDVAGLLEQARIYAIRDNTYYSTYILTASGSAQVEQAYVDMPQGSNPKNGGASVQTGDPTITIEADIVQEPASSAPNTANLKSLLLPSTTPVTPTDTSVTAATFGPRGLPCTPVNATLGSVCDSSGGPTAYWTFLENTKAGSWQAVTVTPAGRIRKWFYNGSTWQGI